MAFTPKQQNWKWFQNDAAEPTSALAAENTAPAVNVAEGIIRLRLTIAETGGTAGSGAVTLEHSPDDTNWTAMGSANAQGTVFSYANGAATEGNTLSGFLTTDATTKGLYHENGTRSESWAISDIRELDFAISFSGTLPQSQTYYFRQKIAGSPVALNSGESHPQLTFVPKPTSISASRAQAYSVLSTPAAAINVSKAQAYSVLIDIQESINVSKVLVYSVLSESTAEPPYDDGTPVGGIVFGGGVVEVGTINYSESGSPDGGIIIGGASGSEVEPVEVHQTDGAASGGIVFGGSVAERWYAPWAVAVKGGTYRIGGVLYTLDENDYYEGLGAIAATVTCGAPPSTVGRFRYDLLSIDTSGTITVTAGTEATTPVMPSTPSSELKLDHVLRYNGQARIVQSDIGKMWTAPVLTTMTAIVTDDELAWGEASTAINVYFFDQYLVAFSGSKVITAEITTGNGTIAPSSKSGSGTSFSFTYTRGGADPGDVSPVLTFSSPTGAFVTAFIKLLDAGGDLMV